MQAYKYMNMYYQFADKAKTVALKIVSVYLLFLIHTPTV